MNSTIYKYTWLDEYPHLREDWVAPTCTPVLFLLGLLFFFSNGSSDQSEHLNFGCAVVITLDQSIFRSGILSRKRMKINKIKSRMCLRLLFLLSGMFWNASIRVDRANIQQKCMQMRRMEVFSKWSQPISADKSKSIVRSRAWVMRIKDRTFTVVAGPSVFWNQTQISPKPVEDRNDSNCFAMFTVDIVRLTNIETKI